MLTELTAISPLDGRYRNRLEDLSTYISEFALIKTRVEVETKYLIELSKAKVIRTLTPKEKNLLSKFGRDLTLEQAQKVKEIEDITRHDVKAVERMLRAYVNGTSLKDITELIHFALTSEDINNLSYRLMLTRLIKNVCLPALNLLIEDLTQKAQSYKKIVMLARTHGQHAVPTTLGKEFINFTLRLDNQVKKLENIKLTGKLTGAVGNFNAHVLTVPKINWIKFSTNFVKGLGLEPNLFTTQICPYEDMIEVFQVFQRINGIIIDIDQDIWRYISDNWFIQENKKGEIGSSTMPQKINPIDFENSEGNAQIANSLWKGMCRKLATSRLQRDLSDSTVLRNMGTGLGLSILAYQSLLTGLKRIHPNAKLIEEQLNENYSVITEGVQTLLRAGGEKDPYSLIASLSKGQKLNEKDWEKWVENLPVKEELKLKLKHLSPKTYIGNAVLLVDLGIARIKGVRRLRFKRP